VLYVSLRSFTCWLSAESKRKPDLLRVNTEVLKHKPFIAQDMTVYWHFPGLSSPENATVKFQDFPGFPGLVKTLQYSFLSKNLSSLLARLLRLQHIIFPSVLSINSQKRGISNIHIFCYISNDLRCFIDVWLAL